MSRARPTAERLEALERQRESLESAVERARSAASAIGGKWQGRGVDPMEVEVQEYVHAARRSMRLQASLRNCQRTIGWLEGKSHVRVAEEERVRLSAGYRAVFLDHRRSAFTRGSAAAALELGHGLCGRIPTGGSATLGPVPRERRLSAAPRRGSRRNRATGSSSDDPGEGEGDGDPSPPSVTFRLQHPRFGRVNKALARFLREGGE